MRQIEFLQPGVGNHRSGRLKLIRADIDGVARDARIAIQVGASGCERILAGIDAGRIGLQAQVGPSARVHEQRRVGDVADTTGVRRGAAVEQ